MRDFFKEYVHIITTVLTALLFGLGCFYFLINAFHASSMNKTVYVNKNDVNFTQYMSNVDIIDSNVKGYNYNDKKFDYDIGMMESISSKIGICSTMLKDEGSIYTIENNSNIGFSEVYDLNNYFINTLMDNCFVANISWLIRDENLNETEYSKKVLIYNNYVNSLVDNAKYLRNEMRDNSSYYFNTGISNAMIRNNLGSIYQKVIRNYVDFSGVIADLSKYLVEE